MGDGVTPIIRNAGGLLQRYDVLFCDVWGVVHDGHLALGPAADALIRFRQAGGTVILVSNAPVPNHQVARMLLERQLSRQAWDAIVSSGDIALRHITQSGLRKLFAIGPQDRDAALFEKAGTLTSKLELADAVLCSGSTTTSAKQLRITELYYWKPRTKRFPLCAPIPISWSTSAAHSICARVHLVISTKKSVAKSFGQANRTTWPTRPPWNKPKCYAGRRLIARAYWSWAILSAPT
jgi:ribonucleotide monophosphatase NagD (HAD superfamily)